MKNKKIIIIVVIVIFVLMLIPIPTRWKNGVTEYKAILYKYTKVQGKKITTPKGETYIYPEYESIKRLAEKEDISLKELYKLKK